MRRKITLHLDTLPCFETSPLFYTLEPSTEAAFRRLPNAHERGVAALRFGQRIGGSKNDLGVSEDHVRIMQVAYLRAALMEYVAIEEVLSTDLQRCALVLSLRFCRGLISSPRAGLCSYNPLRQPPSIVRLNLYEIRCYRLAVSTCHRYIAKGAVTYLLFAAC